MLRSFMQSRLLLDLDLTIDSGQVFLWNKLGSYWYGIHGSSIIKTWQGNGHLELTSHPAEVRKEHLFRLDDDMSVIAKSIGRDSVVRDAMSMFGGVRLMRQEPYQCMISFICATNTSIATIRKMLFGICERFGRKMEYDGRTFHIFPEPKHLADATINELHRCSVGYRAKFIRQAARAVQRGDLDLDYLKRASYAEAKEQLMSVLGIGPKVSDCILLFSLEKLEAFPIDVWISRAISTYYASLFDRKPAEGKISPAMYRKLSEGMRRHFGPYAGYAQQFLYCYARKKL